MSHVLYYFISLSYPSKRHTCELSKPLVKVRQLRGLEVRSQTQRRHQVAPVWRQSVRGFLLHLTQRSAHGPSVGRSLRLRRGRPIPIVRGGAISARWTLLPSAQELPQGALPVLAGVGLDQASSEGSRKGNCCCRSQIVGTGVWRFVRCRCRYFALVFVFVVVSRGVVAGPPMSGVGGYSTGGGQRSRRRRFANLTLMKRMFFSSPSTASRQFILYSI